LFGSFFLGCLLIAGVFNQYRTGQTYGATGKGRIYKGKDPVYFHYLGIIRTILGAALLLLTIIRLF